MSRIVLLGLGDRDVDVLSRIPHMDPRPDVLVAHPDPTALVLQLASLSELPTTTSLPSPRKGDVVVVPAEGGPRVEDWIDAFKEAGATIVSPETLHAAEDLESEVPEPGTREPDEAGDLEGDEDAEGEGKPKFVVDEIESFVTPSDDVDGLDNGTGEEPEPASKIEAPPVDIWSDPEATFRYLVERSLGRAQATLWWDGGMGIWVPCVRTGPAPVAKEKSVVELPSALGKFRLTGNWVNPDAVPVAALTRVAEDIALREAAAWEKVAAKLPGPQIGHGPGAVREWAEAVIAVLDPETGWVWKRTAEGWKLQAVHGPDVVFSGALVVSERMLDALFAGEDLHWERWRPADHVSILLGFAKSDVRWPLRWERVKKALAENR